VEVKGFEDFAGENAGAQRFGVDYQRIMKIAAFFWKLSFST
jgi:hypothetical protein